jgi:hypothetical protein
MKQRIGRVGADALARRAVDQFLADRAAFGVVAVEQARGRFAARVSASFHARLCASWMPVISCLARRREGGCA